MEYPLSISEFSPEVKKKSYAKMQDSGKQIDIAVARCAVGMFHALIPAHFTLPAGGYDFKPDDFTGKQKKKKHRTDDQGQ